MKTFFAFVKKEFRHIFRDRRTLMILFGMPVAQVMLFGFALNNEVKNAGIGILDYAGDHETIRIRQELDASEYFRIVRDIQNEAEISESFERNETRMVVIFPEDFAGKIERGETPAIRLVTDASDPNQAQVLVGYASGIMQTWLKESMISLQSAPILGVRQRMLFNPELKSVYMFVPGVMGMILLLVSAMMTSLTIAREKETGTMELLLVSPLRSSHIIFGKVAPYWVLSFLIAVIVILLGIFILGMPLAGSVTLLAIACLLFSFTALSLGIFISSIANSQMAAMFGSMFALLMPTMLLSGFIFPIENMPLPLRVISHIIPARWFIQIIKGVMIQGSGLELLWKPFAVLVFITAVLVALGIRNVKPRLE